VLPALTALAAAPGPACGLARVAVWVILLQLWGDVASAPLVRLVDSGAGGLAVSGAAMLLWLARELAWWWTVAVLLALLLAMVPDLPGVAALWRRPVGELPGGRSPVGQPPVGRSLGRATVGGRTANGEP
jgi:hypothetical protein